MDKQKLLSDLPSVDEIVKSKDGIEWQQKFPRVYVVRAIRETIQRQREAILDGRFEEVGMKDLLPEIERQIEKLSRCSLNPLINATGIVIHTNLGRSILSDAVLEQATKIAGGYSNLEYDLEKGQRGKRYSHVQRLLKEITGAEAGIVVNNNAAAVFVCLTALARGREVIVSRGELVEIGGSFRIPDVMASSGALLKEVGTTNKTHGYDYENALNDNTALMLKVHQANFRMIGFTEALSIEEIVSIGKKYSVPVMFDLGSGCLVDLKPYGIHIEPTVQEIVKADADIVTFSGDKLLGGPQAGVIVGKRKLIDIIAKNPLMRAVRVDKMTLAALEVTLRCYLDQETAIEKIPTLSMLLEAPEKIMERAKKILKLLKRGLTADDGTTVEIDVVEDLSQSGGGALAEVPLKTYAVSIMPLKLSVNALENRLRQGNPPVIARIKEDALILDVRTVRNKEIEMLVKAIRTALI